MLVDQLFLRTHLCVHDVCALQMPKRTQQTESQQAAAKRMREAAAEARRLRNAAADAAPVVNPPAASFTGSSSSTVAPSAIAPADDLPDGAAPAERRTKRAKLTAEASLAAAPADSGTDPPPAGRFRRSCRTPTAQVQSNRPLRLLPLLRTARRRLAEVMPQYVYQPHPPGSHAHAPQLSASRCVHRSARHARTTCTRLRCGAGCCGRFGCTDRALHVGRAAARLAGPAAVCLPAAAPAQSHAHVHARPAFDPATAAVRRCGTLY